MDAEIRAIKEVDANKLEVSRIIYKIIKRIIDIIASLIGCIILLPTTLCIKIAHIITKDKGPVFYMQKRIGKDGKTFKMYKYRSMVLNADKKLKKHLIDNPEANEEFLKYRKLKKDPRITKVGKFIRDTSIDEIPQFINILKGEMSLIGPRPYLLREKTKLGKSYEFITKVKPGLTGPWQVKGRNNIDFNDRIKIERDYINNINIKDDLKILFKTVLIVFRKDEVK